DGDDTACLYNHDPSWILGRRGSGTLQLGVDKTGLWFSCTTPNTMIARVVVEGITRGDINGCSFGFSVDKQRFELSDEPDKPDIRWLESIRLHDVSPATFPAYSGTSIGTRSDGRDDVLKQWNEVRVASRRPPKNDAQRELRRELLRAEAAERREKAQRERAR